MLRLFGSGRGPAAPAAAAPPVDTAALNDRPASSTLEGPFPTQAAKRAAFYSAPTEQATEVEAQLTGRLPDWLSGTYLRNGPGAFAEPMVHWFDGYALIAKWRIADGKAYASHKFLKTEAYKAYVAAGGKMKWREFATPARGVGPLSFARELTNNMLALVGLAESVTDNASVNIHPTGDGKARAMTETVRGTIEFDPRSLCTIGQVSFRDKVRGDLTTAHPSLLPGGELVNMVSTIGKGYTVFRQKANADVREAVASIPFRKAVAPSWVHAFPPVTAGRRMVIPEWPIYFNLVSLLGGKETDHILMDWQPEDGTRVHLVPLDGSPVTTFSAPAAFAFHYINAWESEDGRSLHVDVAQFADARVLMGLTLEALRAHPGPDIPRSSLRRITIPLDGSTTQLAPGVPLMKDESAHGHYIELPTCNPAYRGRPYRYAYGVAARRPTNVMNALAKFDTQDGTSKVWHEPGVVAGEPTFVGRPESQVEDEGVVMSMVVGADGTSFMLFLDGQSFEEIARARVPYGIPVGFHGGFSRS